MSFLTTQGWPPPVGLPDLKTLVSHRVGLAWGVLVMRVVIPCAFWWEEELSDWGLSWKGTSHVGEKQKGLIFWVTPSLGSQQGHRFVASLPFHGAALAFQMAPLCLPPRTPKLEEQQPARMASSSPDLPKWLESHGGIFVPEQIFLSQELAHQDLSFYIIIWGIHKIVFWGSLHPLDLFGATWPKGKCHCMFPELEKVTLRILMNLSEIWFYFFPLPCTRPVSHF